jgi:peptidoglycan/LPS O-acetylase OafA/YrhL
LAPFFLAVPLAIALPATHKWVPWFGIPTPDHSLYPNLAAVVGYGFAFGFGWWVHRQAAPFLASASRNSATNLVIAVAATLLCLQLSNPSTGLQIAMTGWQSGLFAWAYAVAGWGYALALVGYTVKYLGGYSAWRRYLSDASYWIYLVHLPVVMALQVVAAQCSAPWWVEFTLIVAVTIALALLTYHWLVRRTWLGAVLNGKRLVVASGSVQATEPECKDARQGVSTRTGGGQTRPIESADT